MRMTFRLRWPRARNQGKVANSPATTVAVINEMRARGPFTDTVLGVTVLKDVAVLVLFTLPLTILTLASKAFAFYYMLQCCIALAVTESPARKVGFGALALVLGFIAVCAVPAG